MWVTRQEGSELTRVDASQGVIRSTVRTGPHPRFLTAAAGSIWTLNQGDGTLSRIDTASQRVTTIALDTPGHGGDIAFGGGMVWTTMPNMPLSAVDPEPRRCAAVGAGPAEIHWRSDMGRFG